MPAAQRGPLMDAKLPRETFTSPLRGKIAVMMLHKRVLQSNQSTIWTDLRARFVTLQVLDISEGCLCVVCVLTARVSRVIWIMD